MNRCNDTGRHRLKYAATINDDVLNEDTDDDYELQYIDIGNVYASGSVEEPVTCKFKDAPNRARRRVRDGDIIISCVRTYLQAIAQIQDPPANLVVPTGFAVIRPSEGVLNARFANYALRNPSFLAEIEKRSVGVSYPAISASGLAGISVHLPPLPLQRAIADYLDRETARLDALVAAKERVLNLLAEKRQALITHAVTCDLYSDVRLRESGVPWLGEIPEHWTVKRLKFLVTGIDQGSSPQCFNVPAGPGSLGVLKTGCVNGGQFREHENKALPHEMDANPTHLVSRGDILMSRAGGSVGLIGSVAMVEREPAAKLLLSDKIFRLGFDPTRTSGRYLVFTMGAPSFRHQITTIISGAEGLANNIAKSDILELSIAVPPFGEQHAIADYLDRKTTALNTLAKRTRDTISLLNERRSALIAAAVTGQIDIRATS